MLQKSVTSRACNIDCRWLCNTWNFTYSKLGSHCSDLAASCIEAQSGHWEFSLSGGCNSETMLRKVCRSYILFLYCDVDSPSVGLVTYFIHRFFVYLMLCKQWWKGNWNLAGKWSRTSWQVVRSVHEVARHTEVTLYVKPENYDTSKRLILEVPNFATFAAYIARSSSKMRSRLRCIYGFHMILQIHANCFSISID